MGRKRKVSVSVSMSAMEDPVAWAHVGEVRCSIIVRLVSVRLWVGYAVIVRLVVWDCG